MRVETINVLTGSLRPLWSGQLGGPGKIVGHTLREFDRIGQPYVVNQRVGSTPLTWVHDSLEGLLEVTCRQVPAILGPNLLNLPTELPKLRRPLRRCIYLLSSQWVVDEWGIWFSECPMLPWAAGVDLDTFCPGSAARDPERVLLYYKFRQPHDLAAAVEAVTRAGFKSTFLAYGDYTQEQFLEASRGCAFGLWVGSQETQGMAFQEALACGLPLLVFDVERISQVYNNLVHPPPFDQAWATTAPYFDERCGLRITRSDQLAAGLEHMREHWQEYCPRDFVAERLSPESCTRDFLRLVGENLEPGSPCRPPGKFRMSLDTQILRVCHALEWRLAPGWAAFKRAAIRAKGG